MKLSTLKTIFIFLFCVCFFACNNKKHSGNNQEKVKQPTPIKLTKAPLSPQFEQSSLILSDYSVKEQTDSKYNAAFNFEVKNYELGVQTEDADIKGIANSQKGQHIHCIINNGPYSAHYTPDISKELAPGNYVVLAFLSRSYHESVKNSNAYYLNNITIGEIEKKEMDLNQSHLFYSRPKGTYSGSDTKKLLLDFYLVNTTLSQNGNKVRATINGQVFVIHEWSPYYIEGLPKGEITIKLELLDAEGVVIEGPYNTVERKVTLKE